ncbi:MAG: fluoride efflux transporter CrcB [Proteobacteria bacterium]|nr:fluoride efflux transporter CrcB [Pseudomonadota bacterium]MDA1355068.1 fluoride efflux transporter CrcB [Pseudomonadota bacterium]
MKLVLAIAFGGAVGSVGRYYVADLAERWFASFLGTGFPYGTVVVNVLGSFIFGALIESFAVTLMPSAEIRALVFVGVLGSFTTFSAFSSDSYLLLERGETGRALLYIFISVAISLGAFFVGLRLLRLILA